MTEHEADWPELSAALAADGWLYIKLRNAFVAARPRLNHNVAVRGLRLHGGQLPASWTYDDLRAEASVALIDLLNAMRLHGTHLRPGWADRHVTADELVESLADRPKPSVDQRKLRPHAVREFLVQWAAPATRMALERAEDDITGHRRGVRLHKAITELSSQRGVLVGPHTASVWANTRNAETYGVAEATRNQAGLAIARPADLDPAGVAAREGISAQIRGRVAAENPSALADIRALATFNRRAVNKLGLRVAADAGLIARWTDMDATLRGVGARETESAAVRDRVAGWRREHGNPGGMDIALAYTVERVSELGRRRLRSSSVHLTSVDSAPTRPLLVDPCDPISAQLFGVVELAPNADPAPLRDEILARVAADHRSERALRLAEEWLDCCVHGVSMASDADTALALGLATGPELERALRGVRSTARIAARNRMKERCLKSGPAPSTRLLLDQSLKITADTDRHPSAHTIPVATAS